MVIFRSAEAVPDRLGEVGGRIDGPAMPARSAGSSAASSTFSRDSP
ncbi:hypothetical protein [Actinoallomurus acanthiterrae]